MKLRYLYFEDLKRDSQYLKSLLKHFDDNNVLLINLVQGSRKVEIDFEIENYIIYNVYDLLDNIVNFDKAVYEIFPNLYILPSSFKARDEIIDVDKIIESIPEDEDYEFDYIFVIYDEYIKLKDSAEKIVFTSDENTIKTTICPHRLVVIDAKINANMNNIIGRIREKELEKSLYTIAENIKNDTVMDNSSESFIDKIKKFFEK
ncbi:MAG: septum site-determining protein MinD [Tissierellia bacterium]|nr:septum site-determining protein MinD [Tissierellia bacterium]